MTKLKLGISFFALAILSCGSFHGSSAQSEPHPAASSKAAAPAATASNLSFQSFGLKGSVISAAAGKGNSATLSLILENTNPFDVRVAIVGAPTGTNDGQTFNANSVDGIASCNVADRWVVEVEVCLKADKPGLTPETFTSIEHGNSINFTISTNPYRVALNKDQPMTLAMHVAFLPDTESTKVDASDPLESHRSKNPADPLHNIKFLSVSFSGITFSN